MTCDVDIDTSGEIVESRYYRSYLILHVILPWPCTLRVCWFLRSIRDREKKKLKIKYG